MAPHNGKEQPSSLAEAPANPAPAANESGRRAKAPPKLWTLSQAVAWLATGNADRSRVPPGLSAGASHSDTVAWSDAYSQNQALWLIAAKRLCGMVPDLYVAGNETNAGAYPPNSDGATWVEPIPAIVLRRPCVLPLEWLGLPDRGDVLCFELGERSQEQRQGPLDRCYFGVQVSERDVRRLAPQSAEAQVRAFLAATMLASPESPSLKAEVRELMEGLGLHRSKADFGRLWKAVAHELRTTAWVQGGRRNTKPKIIPPV